MSDGTSSVQPDHVRCLNAALEYKRRFGWSLLPMKITFGENGAKRPAMRWKRLQRTPLTRVGLLRAFASPAVNGLAVVFGEVSGGLAAADFDDEAGYIWWAFAFPELAATLPTVKTYRGFQVLFRTGLRDFVKGGFDPIDDDVEPYNVGEFRGKVKQYSVLPTSCHPADPTFRYGWVIPPGESIPYIEDPHAVGLVPPSRDSKSKVTGTGGGFSSLSSLHYSSAVRAEQAFTTPSDVPTDCKPIGLEALALRHVPTGVGQRNDCILSLVRELKRTYPNADDVKGEVFSIWWDVARNVVGTRDEEQNRLQFLDAFTRCTGDFSLPSSHYVSAVRAVHLYTTERRPGRGRHIRLDHDALRQAAALVTLPSGLPYTGTTELLVRLCVVLQVRKPEGQFFLSSRDAAAVLGVAQRVAVKKLHRLTADGVLIEEEKGRYAPTLQAGGRASSYRLNISGNS